MPGGPTETAEVLDLLVLGGGVMGLFTAYNAGRRGQQVAVIESGRIGDPSTASFGRTRSYRRDYLDAEYARFADEAMDLWTDFETAVGTEVLVRCGCMNIATSSVTPELAKTYAQLSRDTIEGIGMPMLAFDTESVSERFPYLQADVAYLDDTAGLVNLAAVTAGLLTALTGHGTRIVEQAQTTAITADGPLLRVQTDAGNFVTRSLVITAGHGTNELLAKLPGCTLHIPITKDRPSEAKYYDPPAEIRHQFTSDVMPVIAYLDTGIYLHPIVAGVIEAVKIGYYNPPDIPRGATSIDNIAAFVDQCMPGIAGSAITEVLDVDQCDYDLVGDDDFVLGAVPGFSNVFVGVGWRGTGYKFAPWVGRVLSQLAGQAGTIYDISRFDPARFEEATP